MPDPALTANWPSTPLVVVILAVVTAVLLSIPAAVPGVTGLPLSWVVIGGAVFVARRHTGASSFWLVVTPAAVALALTAAFVRRELVIYFAIVGIETLMVAGAAVVGTALGSRRGRA